MDYEPAVRSIIRRHQEEKRRMSFVILYHLPEEVLIHNILLNLPVESLLKLRCVSRYFWNLITSSSFVRLHLQHQHRGSSSSSSPLLISTRYVANCVYDDGISRAYIDVIHNYICNFSVADPSRPEIVEMNCPFEYADIRASCNGLLYLHGREIRGKWSQRSREITKSTPSYIWNPCTKEYKELPSPPPSMLLKDHQEELCFDDSYQNKCSSGFCGFGYDRTNDEYKILYFEYLVENSTISSTALSDKSRTLEEWFALAAASATVTTEFKLYTLGTNTWKSITDNPYSSSLYFGHHWQRIGMLVNGALHWIMSSEMSSRCATKAKIIAFDMDKEVFREVQKPPPLQEQEHEYYGNLQVLQGCLCICRFLLEELNNEVDIWMLKEDSWTKLFRLAAASSVDGACPEPHEVVISEDYFKVLRLCENDEIVMMRQRDDLVVYNPINHKARHSEKFEEAVKKYWNYQMDYTESLVSLNSATYNAPAVPKRIHVLHTAYGDAGRDSYLNSRLFVKSLC